MDKLKENKKTTPANLKKQGFLLVFGLTLLVDGFVICFVNFGILPVSLKQIWPFFVIFFGITFLFSDLFIFGRLRTAILFPSIMLIILGAVFLVFSTDVFQLSFRKFISVSWPIVLVVFGIVLLSVYGIQRLNNKQFPYMQDDTLEEDSY
ncbi:MAG: hypothetical protein KBS64_06125 [Treponema sp.]|nr:hypothetical protein [Candidatus Treponema equi]